MGELIWRRTAFRPSLQESVDAWYDKDDILVAEGTLPPPGYFCHNSSTVAEKIEVKPGVTLSVGPSFPKLSATVAAFEREREVVNANSPPLNAVLTLPTDSAARKEVPVFEGCIAYFPAALAGIARVSKQGNDKHNPGEPLHHARGKSMDHTDCITRHMIDVKDLLAAHERRGGCCLEAEQILHEARQAGWRMLAWIQELEEEFGGAPLAPNARAMTSTRGEVK